MSEMEQDLDFRKLRLSDLIRDGETPTHSIVAVHTKPDSIVVDATEQLIAFLTRYMPSNNIVLLQEEAVQLHSGEVLPLGNFSLVFSLVYPTAPSRMYQLQFGAPPGTVLH